MVSQNVQPGRHNENKSFEVLERGVSGSPDINWREQAKNIFDGFRKLPELGQHQQVTVRAED